MPLAIENRGLDDLPVVTRTALTRLAGGASLIAVREGVAVFDQQVEVNGEKRNLEIALRQVDIRSGSVREEVIEKDGKTVKSRLADVIWTTGASVRRYSWYDEEFYDESIEVSDKAIRMDRMKDGAPLLNSHYSYDLADVLGRVEKVWLENGNGMATVRFSNRSSIDDIWQDVQDGILTKISVGYRVHEWNIVRKDGQVTTKRAVDWEPYEISLVAIPADSGCSVRAFNGNPAADTRMEGKVPQPTENTPAPTGTETDAARSTEQTPAPAATETDATRTTPADENSILRYAADPRNGVDMSDAIRSIDEGTTLRDFMRANVDKIAARAKATELNPSDGSNASGMRNYREEMALRAEMFSAEILDRTAIATIEVSDKARQYADHGARGGAIAYLKSVGEHVDERASDGALIQQALQRSVGGGMTSHDFLSMYAKPAQAAVDNGWKQSIPETNWQELAGNLPMTDFDGRQFFSQSLFSGIGRASEDGELPLARMSGNSYTAKVETSGIHIMLTAHAIIRDNVGIFMEAMRDLGISWNLYREAQFMDTLDKGYVQTGAGKQKLFREGAGGNIIPIDALDEDGIEKLVLALRGQRQDPKLGGTLASVAPRYLIVSQDMERKAKKAIGVNTNASKSEDEPVYKDLQVKVVDTFAPKTVYLTGGTAMRNMIKRAFLQGDGSPRLERMAMTSVMRTDWESIDHSSFVGASVIGAVKAKLPA